MPWSESGCHVNKHMNIMIINKHMAHEHEIMQTGVGNED